MRTILALELIIALFALSLSCTADSKEALKIEDSEPDRSGPHAKHGLVRIESCARIPNANNIQTNEWALLHVHL